jgi:hypothetical protein
VWNFIYIPTAILVERSWREITCGGYTSNVKLPESTCQNSQLQWWAKRWVHIHIWNKELALQPSRQMATSGALRVTVDSLSRANVVIWTGRIELRHYLDRHLFTVRSKRCVPLAIKHWRHSTFQTLCSFSNKALLFRQVVRLYQSLSSHGMSGAAVIFSSELPVTYSTQLFSRQITR